MALPKEQPHFPLATLPHLKLQEGEPISMGPIDLLPESSGVSLLVHPSLPKEMYPELLSDAQALLYFAASAKSVYFGQAPPPTPCIYTFTQNGIESVEQKVEIEFDSALIESFGGLLIHLYLSEEKSREKELMCQAIHLFNAQFHPIYQNVGDFLWQPETASERLFHSLFLPKAFTLLDDIPIDRSRFELKKIYRSRLQIKFGRPVEILWNWIESFFSYHKSIFLPESESPLSSANPSLTFPLDQFGQKLFIYSICWKLKEMGLMKEKTSFPPFPLHFSTADPRELLTYLWSEENMLKKLSILLMQKPSEGQNLELEGDIALLCDVYELFMKRFKSKEDLFIPMNENKRKELLQAIQAYREGLPKGFLPK